MKSFARVLIAALMICMFSSQAFAGWLWNKKIMKIQGADTGVTIAVANSDGSAMKNYSMTTTNTNQILSIGLTALSLGKLVHVELDGSTITSIVISDE